MIRLVDAHASRTSRNPRNAINLFRYLKAKIADNGSTKCAPTVDGESQEKSSKQKRKQEKIAAKSFGSEKICPYVIVRKFIVFPESNFYLNYFLFALHIVKIRLL